MFGDSFTRSSTPSSTPVSVVARSESSTPSIEVVTTKSSTPIRTPDSTTAASPSTTVTASATTANTEESETTTPSVVVAETSSTTPSVNAESVTPTPTSVSGSSSSTTPSPIASSSSTVTATTTVSSGATSVATSSSTPSTTISQTATSTSIVVDESSSGTPTTTKSTTVTPTTTLTSSGSTSVTTTMSVTATTTTSVVVDESSSGTPTTTVSGSTTISVTPTTTLSSASTTSTTVSSSTTTTPTESTTSSVTPTTTPSFASSTSSTVSSSTTTTTTESTTISASATTTATESTTISVSPTTTPSVASSTSSTVSSSTTTTTTESTTISPSATTTVTGSSTISLTPTTTLSGSTTLSVTPTTTLSGSTTVSVTPTTTVSGSTTISATPTTTVTGSTTISVTPTTTASLASSTSTTVSITPTTTTSRSTTPSPTATATPGFCDPSFSDPQASDQVPSSDPVSSSWVNPGEQYDLQDQSLWDADFWGDSDPIIDTFDDSIRLTSIQWSSNSIYMFSNSTVTLENGVEHRFTFNIWQNDTNTFNGVTGTIDTFPFDIYIAILDFIPSTSDMWKWLNTIDEGRCSASCTVFEYVPFILNTPLPTTEATALTFDYSFTPDYNYNGVGSVMISIKQSSNPRTNGGNNYFFTDLFFEKKDLARTFSTPLLVSSPYVDVPFAPNIPTPTQSNCPHLRSGLSNWHDPSIWPGSVVPQANGSPITIPSGLSVLISSCSLDPNGVYGTIYVPAGTELIFSDAPIQMRVQNIHVNGGHLWIGSETCRLYSHITITLDDSATNVSWLGRKGITSIDSGIIDIHGKLFQKTWTRIASPAILNDDRVLLMEDVNWEVGQKVALISTVWRDHIAKQNEVLTIKAIEGRKVQFEERLNYYHHAGIEYQAEIVLLSRRILIQGDEISETRLPNIGGHILVNGDIGRFSGVQTYRMGQTNIIARYPFHFHLMGESPESYFQDCSVYKAFYRCYTMHGTNSSRVSRNTAFDVLGHCYYIEDGVEENNLYEFNFAGYIKPLVEIDFYANGYGQDGVTIYQSDNLAIPADGAVAGFYISNANNNFTGNAASGGFAGFSFINFPKPIGNHRNDPVVPQQRPLLRFYGNTAHSASYQWNRGACIYTGGNQEYDASDKLFYEVGRKSRNTLSADGSTPEWMMFYETRVFLCNRGLNHWGDRAETIGYAAHDITKGLTLFGEAYVNRAVIDGKSSNILLDRPTPTRAFEYYDTHVKTILDDITIMNLEETPDRDTTSGTYGIVSMTHSDVFKPQGINAARNMKWVNIWENGRIGNSIRDTGASRFYNVIDYDGSILDTGVKTVLGSANDLEYGSGSNPTQRIKEWWNIHSSCVLHPEFTIYTCDKQLDQEIVNLQIDVNQLTASTVSGVSWPEQPATDYVGTISHFGYDGDDRRSGIMTANPGITGISGDTGMYAYFDNGTPKEIFVQCRQIPVVDGDKKHVIFALKYPKGISFQIQTQHLWKSSFTQNCTLASTFAEMYNNPDGTSYFLKDSPDGQQWLFLKLIYRHFDASTPESSGYYERNGMRLYDVTVFYWYRIATCSTTCPWYDRTATGPLYTGTVPTWTVTDEVPDFVSSLLG